LDRYIFAGMEEKDTITLQAAFEDFKAVVLPTIKDRAARKAILQAGYDQRKGVNIGRSRIQNILVKWGGGRYEIIEREPVVRVVTDDQ
jgi:hypothetical protein